MDMSPELIGTISIGAGLAAIMVGLFAWLRQDIKEQGKEIKQQGQELRKEIKEQGQKHSDELTEVKVEVAALKATVETYFRVRVDPPPQAAVADDPEEYGSN
ncbi:MAG: YtxH domain-containing protein [Gammaproteobacteria bacterium]|nr:YtxH domain-containing protein [Gammaproteobacteria bacterium]